MGILETLKAELMTFLASMLPVIELRGGIPFGMALGIGPFESFLFAYFGSLLPAPFILLLLKPVLRRFSHLPFGVWLDHKFRIKATAHSNAVQKYGWLGLAVFVAIPLPGTGVWSGSVIAAFLDLRFRKSFFAIAIGNFIAGIAILAISGVIRGVF